MRLTSRRHYVLALLWVALALLIASLMLGGCSSSQRTLTLPPQEPSINTATDSVVLDEMPPAELDVAPTRPVMVRHYDAPDGPSAEVRRVQVSSDAVTLLFASGTELEYEPPRYGETFQWLATGDTTGRAGVAGEPEEEERTVTEQALADARPWYVRWWDQMKFNLAVLGGVVALAITGFFVYKISNPLSWL